MHYVDFDRRLDEWVGMDRVDLAAGQQKAVALHNGDKRRVTTRMKRECFRVCICMWIVWTITRLEHFCCFFLNFRLSNT